MYKILPYQDENGCLNAYGNDMSFHLVTTHSYIPGNPYNDIVTARQVCSFLEVLANAFPSDRPIRAYNKLQRAKRVIQLVDDFQIVDRLDESFVDETSPIMLDVDADDLTITMTEYAVYLFAQDPKYTLRELVRQLFCQGWVFSYNQEEGFVRPRSRILQPSSLVLSR